MKISLIKKTALFGLAAITISACSSREPILPGERIAISSGDNSLNLIVDAGAAAEGVGLPAALTNDRFEAPGANAGHAGGHFAVDHPLKQSFREDVGISVEDGSEMAQPVVNARAVFTLTPGGIVTASDITSGDLIWEIDLDPSEDESQLSTTGGLALSLKNGVDTLYAHAAKETIFALNTENGQIIWSSQYDTFLKGGPTVDGDLLVITDTTGRLYALSALDGEEVWNRIGSLEDTSISGASFPAINGNDVILSGGDGEFLALSSDQGTFQWGENLSPIELRTALDGIPDIKAHPVHDGGLVFVVTHSGMMYAFNAQTGRMVWDQRIQSIEMPWVSGQSVFVTTIDGRVVALRRNDGAVRWVAELPGAYNPDLPIKEGAPRYTAPVVVSGKLALASDQGSLYILDAATGRIENTLSTNGAVQTAPIVANNTVYVINASGNLIAYR